MASLLPIVKNATLLFANQMRRISIPLLLLMAVAVPLLFASSGIARAAKPVVIMMFGDSITAGFGLPPADILPTRLEAELNAVLAADKISVKIINAGISGDTTAGGLARIDWALADTPQVILIALGGNDGLRGIDPTNTRNNLDGIIDKTAASDIHSVLFGMLAPPNLGQAYEKQFNAIFPELATKHAIPLYPFLLEGVAAERDLNQRDGIHPNAAGVDVMVRLIVPFLVPHLVEIAKE